MRNDVQRSAVTINRSFNCAPPQGEERERRLLRSRPLTVTRASPTAKIHGSGTIDSNGPRRAVPLNREGDGSIRSDPIRADPCERADAEVANRERSPPLIIASDPLRLTLRLRGAISRNGSDNDRSPLSNID